MYCRYCGVELPDDSVFCNKCGKRQTPGESKAPPPPPPKKHILKVYWADGVIVGNDIASISITIDGMMRGGVTHKQSQRFSLDEGRHEVVFSFMGTSSDRSNPIQQTERRTINLRGHVTLELKLRGGLVSPKLQITESAGI